MARTASPRRPSQGGKRYAQARRRCGRWSRHLLSVTALGVAAHARNRACFSPRMRRRRATRSRRTRKAPRNRVPLAHRAASATSPVSTHVACPVRAGQRPVLAWIPVWLARCACDAFQHAPAKHTWLIPQRVCRWQRRRSECRKACLSAGDCPGLACVSARVARGAATTGRGHSPSRPTHQGERAIAHRRLGPKPRCSGLRYPGVPYPSWRDPIRCRRPALRRGGRTSRPALHEQRRHRRENGGGQGFVSFGHRTPFPLHRFRSGRGRRLTRSRRHKS